MPLYTEFQVNKTKKGVSEFALDMVFKTKPKRRKHILTENRAHQPRVKEKCHKIPVQNKCHKYFCF